MSRKKRYIKKLSTEEKADLEAGKKYGKSEVFRNRCHAILLSEKGYEVEAIQDIFAVAHSTVYNWLNRWDTGGYTGLQTQVGQGRKPTLSVDNQEHVEAVKRAVKKRAQEGANLLATIEEELALEEQLSMDILRPFLKKLISYGNASEEA
jgi:transposase